MYDEPWLVADYRGDIFLDIGANCGTWSKALAGSFRRVWAFEPQPALAARLALTRPSNVLVVPVALAESQQVLTLHCSHSQSRVASFDRRTDVTDGYEQQVITVPLDMLIPAWDGRVDFVKIDVEGAEVRVLLGAMQMLDQQPQLLVEVHNAENGAQLQHLLRPRYADLEVLRHPHYEPESVAWLNHFWLRAGHTLRKEDRSSARTEPGTHGIMPAAGA